MRIKIYDSNLKEHSESRLKFAPCFFPKNECASIAFVNWETLDKIRFNEYAIYYSLKPGIKVNGENLYAVGFNRIRSNIDYFDVKYLIITK